MDIHNFTPFSALAGGILIGLSAVFLLLSSGRIAGISGLVQGALINESIQKRGQCILFLGGLIGGALLYRMSPGATTSSGRESEALISPLPSRSNPSGFTTRPRSSLPTGTSIIRFVHLTVSPSDI